MAFPPDKKKPADKGKKPGGPPQDAAPAGPPVPGMQPGPQKPPLPGEPMDPFAAMQGSAGASPFPPAAGAGVGMDPMGLGGMQGVPASMPPMGMGEPDMDDNPMLAALLSGAQPPQDPYGTLPGESQYALEGIGPADPQMGLQQMLKLLMLAQAGVAPGSPVMSSSGLVSDPPSNPMAGFGPPGGGVGFGMY